MANNENSNDKFTIRHVPASNFRVCAADGAILTQLYDGVDTVFQLTFTRLDSTPVSESFSARSLDQGMEQTGQTEYETPICRIQEFGVRLRPDQALKVADIIVKNVGRLSTAQKKRYGIPDDVLPAAAPTKEIKE